MKYRVKHRGNIFWPQYRYDYWPFWFHFKYPRHNSAAGQLRHFKSREAANDVIQWDIWGREREREYKEELAEEIRNTKYYEYEKQSKETRTNS